MPRRAFVTGVTGQDGYYLSRLLLLHGVEVYGLVRRCARDTEMAKVPHGVTPVVGDITDPGVVAQVAEVSPDEIYNLAAMSHVGDSFACPKATFDTNTTGALHMLEAARATGARMYQASTSEMFGNSPGPQNESTPFDPQSPYAVSKVAAHHLVRLYREAYGVWACAGILFNHESVRRGADFVTQKVCRAAAAIAAGEQDVVELGNLDARRDWGHAEDYVRGMVAMMLQPSPDDYVLATGESYQVRDLCHVAFRAAGITEWERRVVEADEFKRPAEVHHLCGDASKARRNLGWAPSITFEFMIEEMVRAATVPARHIHVG